MTTHFTPEALAPFHSKRREKFKNEIARAGLDGLLVTHIKNVRYLSGFSGTSATMIITPDSEDFLTDFRYTRQAAEQAVNVPVTEYKEVLDSVRDVLAERGVKRLGFEAAHVSCSRFEEMKKKLGGVELVHAKEMVESLRVIKDEPEIAAIRALLGMLAAALPEALRLIRPGAVEREVAVELEYRLRKLGASGPAFDFIVASGARSALPHGVASEKTIGKNEMVTLDWGAAGWGYNSDNTRVFAVGAVDPELEKIYSMALEANLAAMDAVKPGASVREIDAAARGIIEKAGYGTAFGHGTGHGVGLDIHEKPAVSWREETAVEPGMVFTIEPGIYLPGKGGVRIEDMVLVTPSGREVLSAGIPKDLFKI